MKWIKKRKRLIIIIAVVVSILLYLWHSTIAIYTNEHNQFTGIRIGFSRLGKLPIYQDEQLQYLKQVDHSNLPHVFINSSYANQEEQKRFVKLLNIFAFKYNDYQSPLFFTTKLFDDGPDEIISRPPLIYKRVYQPTNAIKLNKNKQILHQKSNYVYQAVPWLKAEPAIEAAADEYKPFKTHDFISLDSMDGDAENEKIANDNGDDMESRYSDDDPNWSAYNTVYFRTSSDYCNRVWKYGQVKNRNRIFVGMGFYYMCHIKGTPYFVKHRYPLNKLANFDSKFANKYQSSYDPFNQSFLTPVKHNDYEDPDIVSKSNSHWHVYIIHDNPYYHEWILPFKIVTHSIYDTNYNPLTTPLVTDGEDLNYVFKDEESDN